MINQQAAAKFPVTLKDGSVVVDERCECGAFMTQHGNNGMAPGHGACEETGCDQFTWAHFVYEPGSEPMTVTDFVEGLAAGGTTNIE